MGKLLPGMIAVAALVVLVGAAHARSAGTKPPVAVPVATDSGDVATVSKKKTDTSDDDIVTGSIKKPKARHPKPDR